MDKGAMIRELVNLQPGRFGEAILNLSEEQVGSIHAFVMATRCKFVGGPEDGKIRCHHPEEVEVEIKGARYIRKGDEYHFVE